MTSRLVHPTTQWLLPVLLFAAGCSNHQILPDTGPDIQEVYQRHLGGQRGAPARPPTEEELHSQQEVPVQHQPVPYRPTKDGNVDLVGYTRAADNEIEQLFPLLPNPQIVIYVPPHMTAKGRPVPGYTTVTRMYDKDEYALPGEWIPDYPRATPAGGLVSDLSLTASRAQEGL